MALSRYFRGPTGIKAGRCSCMNGNLGCGKASPPPWRGFCSVLFLYPLHCLSSGRWTVFSHDMGADGSGSVRAEHSRHMHLYTKWTVHVMAFAAGFHFVQIRDGVFLKR